MALRALLARQGLQVFPSAFRQARRVWHRRWPVWFLRFPFLRAVAEQLEHFALFAGLVVPQIWVLCQK